MTRIAVIDPQPAIRAGLGLLLRSEPGLVPVGAAASAEAGGALVRRLRPDVVLLEPELADGDGLRLCRRLKAAERVPKVLIYAALPAPELDLLARVAGADGLVDKTADPRDLFESIRHVARGGTALPKVTRQQLELAAHSVEADDLALLAMLVDRTPPAEVAETLRLDRRRVSRRTERVIARLRRPATPAAA